MPATYQLLPRARHRPVLVEASPDRHVDNLLAPELWARLHWGLASKDQDRVLAVLLPDETDPETRRRIALDHQCKCLRRAAQFAASLDVPASPPDGVSLYLVAGDAEPTQATAVVNLGTGALRVVDWKPGDGTVLRSSALMDERVGREWTPTLDSPIRWSQVTFVFADHLGMTKDAAFSDNVLFLLLEQAR